MTEIFPEPAGTRRVLAPHILPVPPSSGEGPFHYLSWPGWEIFLRRRLGFAPGANSPEPILLPDQKDAESDFRAIDQLAGMAASLGAGFISLTPDSPESLPALLSGIRSGQASPKSGAPILDDRAYLALWAITEHETRQSEAILRGAQASENRMWAALKGEEPSSSPERPGQPAPEPDRRALYAWRAWRRLAEGILTADDVITPTAGDMVME